MKSCRFTLTWSCRSFVRLNTKYEGASKWCIIVEVDIFMNNGGGREAAGAVSTGVRTNEVPVN